MQVHAPRASRTAQVGRRPTAVWLTGRHVLGVEHRAGAGRGSRRLDSLFAGPQTPPPRRAGRRFARGPGPRRPLLPPSPREAGPGLRSGVGAGTLRRARPPVHRPSRLLQAAAGHVLRGHPFGTQARRDGQPQPRPPLVPGLRPRRGAPRPLQPPASGGGWAWRSSSASSSGWSTSASGARLGPGAIRRRPQSPRERRPRLANAALLPRGQGARGRPVHQRPGIGRRAGNHCPRGQPLRRSKTKHTEQEVVHRADATTCNACPVKAACTESDRGRSVHRSFFANDLGKVRGYHATEAYRKAMRKRQVWVEPLFAEAKAWHGLRCFRVRGLGNVNIEGQQVAAGQSLKRFLVASQLGSAPRPLREPGCPAKAAPAAGRRPQLTGDPIQSEPRPGRRTHATSSSTRWKTTITPCNVVAGSPPASAVLPAGAFSNQGAGLPEQAGFLFRPRWISERPSNGCDRIAGHAAQRPRLGVLSSKHYRCSDHPRGPDGWAGRGQERVMTRRGHVAPGCDCGRNAPRKTSP